MVRAKGKMPPRDPGLAGVLSFLLPGLGQIYVGRVARGFIHFGVHVLSLAAFLGTLLGFSPVAAPGAETSLGNALVNSVSIGALALLVAISNWVFSVTGAMSRAFFASALDRAFEPDGSEANMRVPTSSTETGPTRVVPIVGESETAAASDAVSPRQKESTPAAPALSSFSRALYELLEFRNMREEDLIRLSGLEAKEIRSLLDGAPPDSRQLEKLADALDVSVELLKSYV